MTAGGRGGSDGGHKTLINFNFENCVTAVHEGVPGSPTSTYRIRLRTDQGYKLADIKCEWVRGSKKVLRVHANAKDAKSTVRASKSFELFIDPACQVVGAANPSVTRAQDKDECWIEFQVVQLPPNLPTATD